jgi:hypothetical protein
VGRLYDWHTPQGFLLGRSVDAASTLDQLELQALVLVTQPPNRPQSARMNEHQVRNEEVRSQIHERLSTCQARRYRWYRYRLPW